MDEKRMWALKDLRITKTAIVKSLIESRQIEVDNSDTIREVVAELVDVIYSVTPEDEKHLPQEPKTRQANPYKGISEQGPGFNLPN